MVLPCEGYGCLIFINPHFRRASPSQNFPDPWHGRIGAAHELSRSGGLPPPKEQPQWINLHVSAHELHLFTPPPRPSIPPFPVPLGLRYAERVADSEPFCGRIFCGFLSLCVKSSVWLEDFNRYCSSDHVMHMDCLSPFLSLPNWLWMKQQQEHQHMTSPIRHDIADLLRLPTRVQTQPQCFGALCTASAKRMALHLLLAQQVAHPTVCKCICSDTWHGAGCSSSIKCKQTGTKHCTQNQDWSVHLQCWPLRLHMPLKRSPRIASLASSSATIVYGTQLAWQV